MAKFLVYQKSFHVGKPTVELHHDDLFKATVNNKHRWDGVLARFELEPGEEGLSLSELDERYRGRLFKT